MAMELGAFTPFLWMIKAREMIWDILEEETGARLTHSFGRIGGMATPPTADFKENARAVAKHILERRRRSARSCCSGTASSSTAWRASASSAQADAHRRSAGRARACARPACRTTCARRTRT